jgi:hypothetical protein
MHHLIGWITSGCTGSRSMKGPDITWWYERIKGCSPLPLRSGKKRLQPTSKVIKPQTSKQLSQSCEMYITDEAFTSVLHIDILNVWSRSDASFESKGSFIWKKKWGWVVELRPVDQFRLSDQRSQKCKDILVTGHGGPYGCKTSRVQHYLDNRLTDGGKVVSLMRRSPFNPRNIPGTHFC